MTVRNSLSVRAEAQTGEEPMEKVLTAKALTEQAPMEEVTAPLRSAHASFK